MISKKKLEKFLNDEILILQIDCRRYDEMLVGFYTSFGRAELISRIEKRFGLKLNWPNNRWEPNNFDFESLTKE